MQALIDAVAEAFDLQTATVHNGQSCSHLIGWLSLPGIGMIRKRAETPDIICLAAYAKAELAKRGWFLETSCTGRVWATDGSYDFGAINYEPSDPLSEAKAILKCIADALQSNSFLTGCTDQTDTTTAQEGDTK